MPPKTTNASKDALLGNYILTLRTHERRAALVENAKRHGTLKILKQLSMMRDYNQWNPRAHEIMTKDLEYLQKVFQKEKETSKSET